MSADNVPASPASLAALEMPERYMETGNGDNFLLYDSGAASGAQRMSVFSTDVNIAILETHDDWYGTFKTVPLLFKQLYIIGVQQNSSFVPLVYSLLPDKMQQTYARLIHVLLDRIEAEPNTMHIDFEKGMRNAIRIKMPEVEVRGCFFHLVHNNIETHSEHRPSRALLHK